MREAWGCEKRTRMSRPTFAEEIGDTKYRYWRCPIRHIPRNIAEFMVRYDFYKRHQGAAMPGYDDIDPRYLQAENYYESKYNEYMREALNG